MSSDSDSDEEYKPDLKEVQNLSEEDSDEEIEALSEDDAEIYSNTNSKRQGNKRMKTKIKKNSQIKRLKEDEECYKKDKLDNPINEIEEKKRADDLWASFLGDTESNANDDKNLVEINKEEPKKITVTETYEFAGESVKVTKEIEAPQKDDLPKPRGTESEKPMSSSSLPGKVVPPKFNTINRPKPGGGLNNLLSQLGKNKKISVLEKSKLDWDGFKKYEGIEEEIQTFNKGKHGYLERQDFLERTDLKQFDIEKSLRQSKQSNR